jgi:hypothetical protein
MSVNGMHNSEALKQDIFGEQPLISHLQNDINAILAKFSPDRQSSPKIQEAMCRIESISDTIATLGDMTRKDIVSLYAETVINTHMSKYASNVAILEAHQQNRIANILGASNDDKFSQVA